MGIDLKSELAREKVHGNVYRQNRRVWTSYGIAGHRFDAALSTVTSPQYLFD